MKNRKPSLSFILTFVFSGLGQIYNGEFKKGISFLFLNVILFLFLGISGLFFSFKGLLLAGMLMILFRILISVEAYRKAKTVNPYQLKPLNSFWKYGLFILFGFLINSVGIYTSRSIIGYEAFIVPTPSMEPTIDVNDMIIASKIKLSSLELGEIVTFSKGDGEKYICRILGLPGDRIEIKDDRVIINGRSEVWKKEEIVRSDQFEYQKYRCKLPNGIEYSTLKMLKFNGRLLTQTLETSNMGETTVPTECVYVIADNRNNSIDSRTYGSISFENIDKTVHYVYWSDDITRIGIKLNDFTNHD